MRKIIHHLRKQSEKDRRHILHLTTLVVGILMIFLWTLSLGKSIANTSTKEAIQQDLKPFSVLKDSVVDGLNSIKGQNSSTPSVTE